MEAQVASGSSVVWGYLEPLVPSPYLPRFNFTDQCIAIGRGETNHIELIGRGVSKTHATVQWNGRTDRMSVVTITDHGTPNGTFVDGEKVKGIKFHQLFDGCTVCFGSLEPLRIEDEEDFRFTFHHPFGRSKKESIFLHYILGDRIGGGLHGHVYRALEKSSGTVFALKTSWKHDRTDSIACAGQETMALMVLEHDNIIRLHEAFFHINGEIIDAVLEYIDGIDLLTLVSRTQLNEVHARELSFQLCLGVAFFHEKQVSHGDMKLDNVLLTREDRPKIKIIDFGLANVQDTYNFPPVSFLLCTLGSASGLSEESISNEMCQKWDDWGVGCIIFNLLASRHPFPRFQGTEAFNPLVDEIAWGALSGNTYEAQDLVRNLLVAHPDDRMSAQAALSHPWLLGYEPYRVSFASVPLYANPVVASPVSGKGKSRAV
ncbi:kinase-like domain-containing protein [Mycena galopus ATCC 62051]|nr:kinase-like domain-containing protein [Mycena galopus ATCC 62051]